jgi:WD40 repeat protein
MYETLTGVQLGHTNLDIEFEFTDLACSADGKHIAASNEDGNVRILDLSPQLTLRQTILADEVRGANSVDWSPDNIHIVTGADNHQVAVWNSITGEQVRLMGEETEDTEDEQHSAPIVSVKWSPTGQEISSSGYDKSGYWDANTGEFLSYTTDGPTEHNHTFSPDGTKLLSVDLVNNSFTVISLDTGYEIFTVKVPDLFNFKATIRSVAWCKNGKYIITGDRYGNVDLWDELTGDHRLTLMPKEGTISPIYSVDISDDGEYIIASYSGNQNIIVWESRQHVARKKIKKAISQHLPTLKRAYDADRPEGAFGPTDPGGHKYRELVDTIGPKRFKLKTEGGKRQKNTKRSTKHKKNKRKTKKRLTKRR